MCMHQEPNFEGNFEIRCAGNAFPFLSEVRFVRFVRSSPHHPITPPRYIRFVRRTSTNTGEAATIRQPEEHPGLLMAIC